MLNPQDLSAGAGALGTLASGAGLGAGLSYLSGPKGYNKTNLLRGGARGAAAAGLGTLGYHLGSHFAPQVGQFSANAVNTALPPLAGAFGYAHGAINAPRIGVDLVDRPIRDVAANLGRQQALDHVEQTQPARTENVSGAMSNWSPYIGAALGGLGGLALADLGLGEHPKEEDDRRKKQEEEEQRKKMMEYLAYMSANDPKFNSSPFAAVVPK